MASLSFTVPGEPRGKGRPRFVRATGRAYTDAQTASYENRIMLAACAAKGAQGLLEPFDGPVVVVCTAYLQTPASASRKRREAMLMDRLSPTKRPDLENISKALLDGMNGVVYRDDAQVIRLVIDKRWGLEPGLEVSVREHLP